MQTYRMLLNEEGKRMDADLSGRPLSRSYSGTGRQSAQGIPQ